MSKKKQPKKEELTSGMRQHIIYLILLSSLSKVFLFILTVFILHSGMDTFGIMYYYDHAVSVFNGSYPYISYYYEYPLLSFIPVIIALIPSLLLNNVFIYVGIFSILMIACDCITTACVYLIARKIWDDPKRAFISACLYISAISAAYFVMIEHSAFSECLLMLGLTMVLYGKDFIKISKVNEYFAFICGYFVKVYPIVALPFVILYKSRSTSLKQEIVSSLWAIIPVSFVLFVPLYILNPESIKTFIPARMDIGYFPNTIIWTLHVWLHDIANINVTIDTVLTFVYICMGIAFAILFYAAYKYKKQDPAVLIKFILCAIMIIVLSFKVRSPQYVVWFAPLMCILIADNVYKMGLFYFTQILAYIEFPLTFGLLWTNIEYTNPVYSTNWYIALILFTLQFSGLILLTWFAIEPIKLYNTIFRSS